MYSTIFGSSCFLPDLPFTFDVFRTSSGNSCLANKLENFFLEQLLRKICVTSPDVSRGVGVVALLSDDSSSVEFVLFISCAWLVLGGLISCAWFVLGLSFDLMLECWMQLKCETLDLLHV